MVDTAYSPGYFLHSSVFGSEFPNSKGYNLFTFVVMFVIFLIVVVLTRLTIVDIEKAMFDAKLNDIHETTKNTF
jgi:competence protein ComGC